MLHADFTTFSNKGICAYMGLTSFSDVDFLTREEAEVTKRTSTNLELCLLHNCEPTRLNLLHYPLCISSSNSIWLYHRVSSLQASRCLHGAVYQYPSALQLQKRLLKGGGGDRSTLRKEQNLAAGDSEETQMPCKCTQKEAV